MDAKMDAKYCREKAELCLRVADGLSLNNPAAEDFRERAKQLEKQEAVRS